MSPLRSVVLCADDFGLSDGVSRGIVALAAAGRLSATGAMTNMPGWTRAAPELAALKDRIGVGLHLNLTTGSPLSPMPRLAPAGTLPPLDALLSQALRRRLPLDEVRAEIFRQLEAFVAAHGAAPAFVDGHQHVHALPGIRRVLIQALNASGLAGRLWLRDPSDRLEAMLRRPVGRGKALVVAALARGFAREAHAAGYATNEGFSGFAPLDLSVPAARVFEEAFRELGPRPVVMCHPGHVDDDLRRLDPAVESRAAELAYLGSDAFAELLARRGIVLSPGPEPSV